MRHDHLKRGAGTALGLVCAALLFGCQPESSVGSPPAATPDDEARLSQQALGEASRPIWVKGEGTGLVPGYRERLLMHLYNRVRIHPQFWGLAFENPPMSGMMEPYLPISPARLNAYMAEAARWQAKHQLESGCICDNAAVGYDPMDPETAEQEKFVNASCCEVGVVDGVAQCVGPLVPCTNPKATLRSQRWALLNKGDGQIQQENIQKLNQVLCPSGACVDPATMSPLCDTDANANCAGVCAGGSNDGKECVLPEEPIDQIGPLIELAVGNFIGNQLPLSRTGNATQNSAVGLSFFSLQEVPESCVDREEPCPGGMCLDPDTMAALCDEANNPECLGLCSGGEDDGRPCSLPTEEMGEDPCDPENYPYFENFTFSLGTTQSPAPVLTDGIHFQLAEDQPPGTPVPSQEAPYYKTPAGQVTYGVHYYELNGDPVGTPTSVEIVLDGTCQALTEFAVPDVLPVTMEPAPFAGALYTLDTAATEGCHPYVFIAKDGDGFEYTYPTYGALQAKIDADGKIALNDDSCPIWTPTRPDLSCSTSPQQCEDGDTRACYTGLYGTQDNGACAYGTESCVGGRWSGACEGEVTPDIAETCGDGIDNDCNGGVDEGCDAGEDPDMGTAEPDMGTGEEDMGAGEEDMGASEQDMGDGGAQDMGAGEEDMGSEPSDGGGDGGGDDDEGCGCHSVHGKVPNHWMLTLIGLFSALGLRRRRSLTRD